MNDAKNAADTSTIHAAARAVSGPAEGEERGWLTGWPMVSIFMVFAFMSYVDREVVSLIVQPLKRDLSLSDFQIGLLLGPAFGFFYALAGLPMGWLLDRFSRRWITTLCVAFWGVATALSGVTTNFLQLFAARMGIGLGESALSPAAHSMIAEQMPPEKLATTLSIFNAGAFVGGGVAIAAGGWLVAAISSMESLTVPLLGPVRPWQFIFLIVGLPTILLAPLALLLREKRVPRPAHAAGSKPAGGESMAAVLKSHWLLFLGLPFGFSCTNVLVCAYKAWTPTFLIREHGWNVADAGMAFGIQQAAAGVIGLIMTGVIVDRMYKRGVRDAHVRWHMYSLALSVPAMVIALNASSAWVFLGFSTVFWLLTYSYVGYAAAALQLFAPGHLRARIAAIYIAFLAIVGAGIGPPLTGWLTDRVFGGESGLHLSLTAVTLTWGPLALLVLYAVGRKLVRMHDARN